MIGTDKEYTEYTTSYVIDEKELYVHALRFINDMLKKQKYSEYELIKFFVEITLDYDDKRVKYKSLLDKIKSEKPKEFAKENDSTIVDKVVRSRFGMLLNEYLYFKNKKGDLTQEEFITIYEKFGRIFEKR